MFPTTDGQALSNFHFITHDAEVKKTKRQVPTLVRAHVMERYHRERRTKKDAKEAQDPTSQQAVFTPQAPVPARHGVVIKWDGDGSVQVKKKKIKKQSKPTSAEDKEIISSQRVVDSEEDEVTAIQRLKAQKDKVVSENDVQATSRTTRRRLEKMDNSRLKVFWERQYQRAGRVSGSLNDEVTNGGMVLLQLLDRC
jgi:hypothetical protein